MPSSPTSDAIALLCWPALREAQTRLLADGGGFAPVAVSDAEAVLARLRQDGIGLALIEPGLLNDEALRELAARTAVVLCQPTAHLDVSLATAAIGHGVQDVFCGDDWQATDMLRWRLQAAVARQGVARAARNAYATDLATGLPHQQQLIEHMSHLLALREREPAPMALLVLRVEGLLTTEARLGATAAAALRRKLAVRLRSGLRASDVVASIGEDSFAVLLAWIDAVADVDGVAAKLIQAVQRPFTVQGQAVALALSVGIGRYPDDGKDAQVLLHIAMTQAASVAGQGRAGFANHVERGPVAAANDDEA